MSKEFDKKCQLCINYDTCSKESSQGCQRYRFYKCEDCIDRIIKNDEIPRCLRGGTPCSEIQYCTLGNNR